MPTLPPSFRTEAQARASQQAKAEYEARRGSARERCYDTVWDKASRGHRRSHPLCLGCQAVGRVTAAELTDHVVPHKGDQAIFWNRSLWQSACRWHHDVVKQKLEALWAQGKLGEAELWLNSASAIALTRELGGA
jgi:5-methylcytosine-specific restriction endonuclease McrA